MDALQRSAFRPEKVSFWQAHLDIKDDLAELQLYMTGRGPAAQQPAMMQGMGR